MQWSSLALLALAFGLTAAPAAAADHTSTPSFATGTTAEPTRTQSSTGTATHTIKVGPKESPHGYVPHSIEADVGDLVVFEFYPRNHSVLQADFGAPCVPADGDFFWSEPFNDFDEVDGVLQGPVSFVCEMLLQEVR